MGTLTDWFVKHNPTFSDKYAIEIMHEKLECIEKKLKENPDDVTYMTELAKVMEMIYDYFKEKGIEPQTLL